MLKEKAFLTVLAVLGGVLFSVGLFYLYQKTKVIVPEKTTQTQEAPTVQPEAPSFFLNIETPEDEQVFDKKIISLSGKTSPIAVVIISQEDKELTLTPSPSGNFATNITLDEGVNTVEIMALDSNGKTIKEKRVITYSTENF